MLNASQRNAHAVPNVTNRCKERFVWLESNANAMEQNKSVLPTSNPLVEESSVQMARWSLEKSGGGQTS
jgi:hypothetical protein